VDKAKKAHQGRGDGRSDQGCRHRHDLLARRAPRQVYQEYVEPNIKKGASLAFAHGFNIHYGLIQPREDSMSGWWRERPPYCALDLRAGGGVRC